MLIGILVMEWDERRGVDIIIKYPDALQVSEKTLMQIVSTHEYDCEPGTVSVAIGGMNVVSYYSGAEKASIFYSSYRPMKIPMSMKMDSQTFPATC